VEDRKAGSAFRSLITPCIIVVLMSAWVSAQQDARHKKHHAMAMPGMGHEVHTPASDLRTALVAAWNAKKIDDLANLYSESAVIILPDGKLVTGRQSIREYFQHLAARKSHVSLISIGSDTSPDLQVEFGYFSESAGDAASGSTEHAGHNMDEEPEIEGKYLLTVKRTGTDWKIQEQVLVLSAAAQ
jgi:ketosteroid isomerase-like protein